jgi:hypothetical protein
MAKAGEIDATTSLESGTPSQIETTRVRISSSSTIRPSGELMKRRTRSEPSRSNDPHHAGALIATVPATPP